MALVKVLAKRERASGRGFWFVLPGLVGCKYMHVCNRLSTPMDLLEVVKLDTKGFTPAKVVQEGVIRLLGFSLVALCKVHKI